MKNKQISSREISYIFMFFLCKFDSRLEDI